MNTTFHNVIDSILTERESFNRIWFASDLNTLRVGVKRGVCQ